MKEPLFEGYWSDKDKETWKNVDWKNRDYKDFPVEDGDPIVLDGYFYTLDGHFTKPIKFVKYLRANPIFSPYYGPVYDTELLSIMENGHFCYPSFDGRKEGPYNIHDRFDDSELADRLSR